MTLLFQSYSRAQAITDILSGVTVALIALPLALALGVASIPAGTLTPFPAPAIGIFTAIIGGFLVSLLGGSRVQIAGPTAAFVTVVLLVIDRHGYDGLLLATVMAGLILILMGFGGLGTLIKFIPYPVTSGFTTGIAVVAIIAVQLPDFLGLPGGSVAPREFFDKIPWLLGHLPELNPLTLLIALGSALFIHLWPKYRAHLKAERIPGAIIAMVGSALLVAVLGWGETADVAAINPLFPAARSGPTAVSAAARQKQIPSSQTSPPASRYARTHQAPRPVVRAASTHAQLHPLSKFDLTQA